MKDISDSEVREREFLVMSQVSRRFNRLLELSVWHGYHSLTLSNNKVGSLTLESWAGDSKTTRDIATKAWSHGHITSFGSTTLNDRQSKLLASALLASWMYEDFEVCGISLIRQRASEGWASQKILLDNPCQMYNWKNEKFNNGFVWHVRTSRFNELVRFLELRSETAPKQSWERGGQTAFFPAEPEHYLVGLTIEQYQPMREVPSVWAC